MPDGPQSERLLRLTPDDPDSAHDELLPRAPETPGNTDPADPNTYSNVSRPVIDHYADTFNSRKVHPQPGFAPGFGPPPAPHEFAAYHSTLFRLALTTPGAAGPVFSSWMSTLYRLWLAGHLGDPTGAVAHDFLRLIAHRPLGAMGRHDIRVHMVLRNATVSGDTTVDTFFFVPAPVVKDVFGTLITSVTYRLFVHSQGSDTFVERGSALFGETGTQRYEVRNAIALSGWETSGGGSVEPSDIVWAFAAHTAGNGLRASRSTNGGVSWADVGNIATNFLFDGALALLGSERFWELDFDPRLTGVYDAISGDVNLFSIDLSTTTGPGATGPAVERAGVLLAPTGLPGQIAGVRGTWGRGSTSSNDAASLTRHWHAFPYYVPGTFEYGVHIDGDGGAPVGITDVLWGPDVELIYPVGAAVAAGRVFAAFYRPGTGTGEFRVVRAADGQDDTAAGGIAWPFIVPAGYDYVGALGAIDNTLFMTYIRDNGGIEFGLAVGEIDQAAQPISSSGDISWTFIPMDPGSLDNWAPQAVSQLLAGLTVTDPVPVLGAETGLSFSPITGESPLLFETLFKRLRVTAYPLSSFPAGGVVLLDGTEVDRVGGGDGRFSLSDDLQTISDSNEHVVVRAEAIDSDGLIYHTTEFRAFIKSRFTDAVDEPRSFAYTTMIEDGGGNAVNVVTAGLLPASVTAVVDSGNFYLPTIADPIENTASFPTLQYDNYVIELFESKNFGLEQHLFYCVTWAQNLRSALFKSGGPWVSGIAGFRELEVSFEVTSARVFLTNVVESDQRAATLTIELALINADTGAILLSLGSRDYNLVFNGPDLDITDNVPLGGTATYNGNLPTNWQLAFLTYLDGFQTMAVGVTTQVDRRVVYRADAVSIGVQPKGNVPLP